jgi:acetoin utilization deacetylase AcuC-like enzyme
VLIVSGPLEAREHYRAGHPERPDRVTAAFAGVEDLHLGRDVEVVEEHPAGPVELARVHQPRYLRELEAFCAAGGGALDQDTFAVPASWLAARSAAGSALAVIERLKARGDGVGFSVARPPGHHALADRAMGFCLLNNVAVAASALAEEGGRGLIVDWDVHHGNGTQDIFWNDQRVLYVSTHQWPLYPGSGRAAEIGGPGAIGYTVNVPVPPRSTGDTLRRAIEEVALPAIETFSPTWVLVSAGFDAHRADPLADLALSEGDFARLATLVAGFAPAPGRLAFFLEGGYDLGALRGSVAATLGAVLGIAADPGEPTSDAMGPAVVTQLQSERADALEEARGRTRSDRILE